MTIVAVLHLCKVAYDTDLHWPIAKKIQVHVFSKKVTLWMWCVKFLSSHEEVTGKVISWKKDEIKQMNISDIVYFWDFIFVRLYISVSVNNHSIHVQLL